MRGARRERDCFDVSDVLSKCLQERAVTITGSSEAVGRAIQAVKKIVDSEKRSGPEMRKVMQVSGSFVGPFAASRSCLLPWQSGGGPAVLRGMIIGRGGENVKAMSRESGAKIEVSRDAGDRDAESCRSRINVSMN